MEGRKEAKGNCIDMQELIAHKAAIAVDNHTSKSAVEDWRRRAEKAEDRALLVYLVIGEVCCHEKDVERQLTQGKFIAEHNKAIFDVAMEVAKFYEEQLDLRMDANARELKALAEIERLNTQIKKVSEESSKLDAENKELREHIKHLEADLKEGEFFDEQSFRLSALQRVHLPLAW
jgi:chromosome segregation ATPase